LNLVEEIEGIDGVGDVSGADSAASNKPLYVVLELSCHQLADLKSSPNIAVVQNITPEHLDYYDTVEEYAQAKSSIARFQKATDIVFYFDHSAPVAKEESPDFAAHIAQLSAGRAQAFSVKTLAELESATGQTLIRDWKARQPESL